MKESRSERKTGKNWGGLHNGNWEESEKKHDNLQVSYFEEPGWPDTLGKHPGASETREEGEEVIQDEDDSNLIRKGSNCPHNPSPPVQSQTLITVRIQCTVTQY